MKKIKEGTYKNARCCWCGSPAKWGYGGRYACDSLPHKDALRQYEYELNREDDYYTEADEQSWRRL